LKNINFKPTGRFRVPKIRPQVFLVLDKFIDIENDGVTQDLKIYLPGWGVLLKSRYCSKN